ncbi:zinc finger RNA-binding protein-like isoform X2 [Hydractinia symbiolongicarpus]|uniref:zinc finger RNA-binding protein-like isoform X2 n=1 Tax=Hydractinia symbiolongicarpus TaxID=13093 RepID=UPI00254C6596|nr:zinc finger RNA-binding protein-like isoform X2 [Hydractinia symbiolongicarpus]
MANYGYGYGNYTSQPQQYSTGTYVSQNASYGYSAQQPAASRVVQGYQPAGNTGYSAGYAQQPQVQSAGSGGYGYFQRASDQNTAYVATQKSQAYGYANTAAVKPSYVGGTTVYQKPQTYVAAAPASSTFTGYTVQRSNTGGPSYNNTSSYQKPKYYGSVRPQPRTQQLHYCDVCKISCGGPQTYKEHLEGQKHKKKAASSTSDIKNLPPGTYKCELCDVICTGKDAFSAHVKGASHMKTLKLHQKLGKPIPDIKVPEDATPAAKKVVKTTAPKINFVGGTKLTSTGGEEKIETSEESQNEIPVEGEPVGETYVEDIKSDVGKIIGFKCTLCDCRFNDLVARNAHIKGRRHRLNYKKKVDPKLVVDMKASRSGTGRMIRSGSLEDRSKNTRQEMVWKQRQQQQMRWEQELRLREEELRRWEHEEFMRRASEDRYWTRPDRHRMHELEYYEWERKEKFNDSQNMFGPPQGPPPPTPDDRLIMSKHAEIYPTEVELKQVQNIVATAEKALKLVSDALEEEGNKTGDSAVKIESIEKKIEPLIKDKDSSTRLLKGVMRVGALAKGLLLRRQLNVDLVVLCAERPTYTLLKNVARLVPEKLKIAGPDEKYNMSVSTAECALLISSTTEPKCQIKVVLTSPTIREEEEAASKDGSKPPEAAAKTELVVKQEPVDPKDALDKEKALQALAALRHAKWFQARANHLSSCVITIRIMRDMCQRVAAFKPLNNWAVELLCEKALASSFQPLGPGEAFRRVLETIASGILLPGGRGLLDPCEKEKFDASGYLTVQEREDVTAAAQQALRLQAFRQLHKILGVEPLKPMSKLKRPADSSPGEEGENKVAKKD